MSDVSQGPGWWLASDGKWYPPEQAPPPAQPVERPTATAAFVCGVIGAVIGLIPIFGIIAIPLGVIGFVLGVIGWRRKPLRAKLARSAALLGVIAIAFGVIGVVIVDDAFDDLDETIDDLQVEDEQN